MPLLDTADVRQRTDHGCGATAFDVLYRFHHGGRSPRWTQELPDPARGMGPDTLELLVRRHFDCVAVGHWDLARLALFARFTPVLCLVTVGHESDHWVCVRGVTRSRVHVQCPDRGRYDATHAEWSAAWTDATAGGAYPRLALTGWPAA